MSKVGTPTEAELEKVQITLDETQHLVPADSPVVHVFTPPELLISLVTSLPTTPIPDPLVALTTMPENIMDTELTPPEKSAEVEDIEMIDTGLTVQAAAAAASAAGAVAAPLVPQGFVDAAAAIEVETAEEEDGELVETQVTTEVNRGDEEDSEISEAEELITKMY